MAVDWVGKPRKACLFRLFIGSSAASCRKNYSGTQKGEGFLKGERSNLNHIWEEEYMILTWFRGLKRCKDGGCRKVSKSFCIVLFCFCFCAFSISLVQGSQDTKVSYTEVSFFLSYLHLIKNTSNCLFWSIIIKTVPILPVFEMYDAKMLKLHRGECSGTP